MANYNELSDFELFKKISKYDSRALEELYNRYSSFLFTIIKKIVPTEETAEHVLVEVFSIIWRKIDKFDFKTGNVYTWLVMLARNRAIDSLRRDRGDAMDFYDEDYENFFILPELAKEIDALDLATALELKDNMENALSKLTDAQKYVIHLAFYQGYTLEEISKELNIPIETVRNKVLIAVKNLREKLVAEED